MARCRFFGCIPLRSNISTAPGSSDNKRGSWVWQFGISVIMIWNLFVIWCLRFVISYYFYINIDILKNIYPHKMTENHLRLML